MLVFNRFAAKVLNDVGNSDELFPIIGDEYPSVTEDYDETDGAIILRRTKFYNSLNELYLFTKWAVVDPVVISGVTGSLTVGQSNSVTIAGSGMGTAVDDVSVFIEYHPTGGLDWIPTTRLLGTITSYLSTSIVVTFDLASVAPIISRGAAKVVVLDSTRGLEESYVVLLV